MTADHYRFDGLRICSGRMLARFVCDDDRDVRTIVVEPAVVPLWALGETAQPHPDSDVHTALVRRAREEIARARSVTTVLAYDRGEHLHRPRPRFREQPKRRQR